MLKTLRMTCDDAGFHLTMLEHRKSEAEPRVFPLADFSYGALQTAMLLSSYSWAHNAADNVELDIDMAGAMRLKTVIDASKSETMPEALVALGGWLESVMPQGPETVQ